MTSLHFSITANWAGAGKTLLGKGEFLWKIFEQTLDGTEDESISNIHSRG